MSERLNLRLHQALNDRDASQELIDALVDLLAAEVQLDSIVSGTATILNAATTVTVTLGVAFNGKLAVVSMAESPTAAAKIWAIPVAGGDLTIAIDVDNTADLDVHYFVDGR